MSQRAELLGAGDEIGLTIDFDHHTYAAATMGIHLDDTVRGLSIGAIGSSYHTLFAQPLHGLLKIAVGFLERLAAVKYSCICRRRAEL